MGTQENAFMLVFDTEQRFQIHSDVSETGEPLMERLLAKGYIAFQVLWQRTLTAQLAVEDDVIFLCDAVNELPEFAAGASTHYVHLGDGELEITSKLRKNMVTMNVAHTPHLVASLLREYSFIVPLEHYIDAWQSLLQQLKHQAE